jgi:hypothetical protein
MDGDWTTMDDRVVLITAFSTSAVGVGQYRLWREHGVEQESMGGEM